MKPWLPDYTLERPASLREALLSLAEDPEGWQPLAGGTDVMVLLEAGFLKRKRLLDLSRIPELRGILETDRDLVFGALTTFTELQECAAAHRFLPNLVKSSRATGALAIQNRGTLGGNIANASPAADAPPCLLAYGAEVDLVSLLGVRTVAYDQFHLGYKRLDLAPDELVMRVRVPKPQGRTFHFFRKVGTRQALAITKISLAGCVRLEDGAVADIRLGLGSAGPVPVRARRAEAALLGRPVGDLPVAEAQAALLEDISPIDDIRSTGHYRRVTAASMLGQMLRELARDGAHFAALR